MTTWLPWISLAIALITLVLTFIRFGREVHLDDKREMLKELDRCKAQCDEIGVKYDRMVKVNDALVEDNRQLKEHNYKLMERITKLTNGEKT